MLGLFGRKKSVAGVGQADKLLYAVGDVHGRADLLRVMVERLRADAETRVFEGRPIIVFLGDYIDRGADSPGVLDQILALEREHHFDVACIRGNHDQFLLDFLVDGASGAAWMNYGGGATLSAYGVSPPRLRTDRDAWRETSVRLAAAMPPSHLDLMNRTRLVATFGNYVFVHAGVRPGLPLEEQDPNDLMGIRGAFINARAPLKSQVVVFGHTPFDEPYSKDGKIGVDTGAYSSGRLTALRLLNTEQDFIQARL